MSMIKDWPLLPWVPSGGYVVVTQPTGRDEHGNLLSVFAKVPPSSLGSGGGSSSPFTLNDALLDDLGVDGPHALIDDLGTSLANVALDDIPSGTSDGSFIAKGALGLDLRDYGAVCNGTTDDTPAFNAALAALPALGGKILIPNNTVLGNAVVSKSCTIEGMGGDYGQASVRPLSLTVPTVFDVSSPFVTIYDLAIAPLSGAVKPSAGTYINVRSTAHRFRAERLTLSEFHEGITLGNMSTAELNGIRGYLYTTGISQSSAFVHITGGFNVLLSGLSASGPGTDTVNCKSGIWVENCGDCTIANSSIIGMGTDLLVNPGSGQTVASLWVVNTYLDTAFRGVDMTATGTGFIGRARLSDVWASSHAAQGMRFGHNADGVDIDSPHVLGNSDGSGAQGAIELNTGCKNIRIRGGQIAGNTGNGVYVGAGVSDWSVIGATIGACGGFAGNTLAGVYVEVGASDRYAIQNNLMVSNGASAIGDHGTGHDKMVVGNPGMEEDYSTFRDPVTAQLFYWGRQATPFSGYRWYTDDGTLRATLTTGLALTGGLGAFGTSAPSVKPTVSGSRGGNAALASLITALASYGLILDGTTA